MAEKRSDLEEKEKKSWLRKLAEKGWQNYEDTVSGINEGLNKGVRSISGDDYGTGNVKFDVPTAGTIKNVAGAVAPMGKSMLKRLSSEFGEEAAQKGKKFYDELPKAMEIEDKQKKLRRFMQDIPEESAQKYGDIFGEGFEESVTLRTGADDIALDRVKRTSKPEVKASKSKMEWVDEARTRRKK